ncbi:MAG: phage terminase large subunit [Patescibacteria group bacterium]|jgi:predicted phage terminase large subunit-like protein
MKFKEIIEVMLKDQRVRLNIVKRTHKFFFYFYFSHYIEFEIAPFQEEMFHITENTSIRNAVIVAFRNSAKSTIFTLSFPLWAILGEQRLKHILIISQTQQKAQMLLQQIKRELETNELLKKDLGPFQEEHNQWNVVSIYLPRYDAKITAASTEQSIRGIRHRQYRPQLLILDDCEDLESVKTQEGRDKLYNWLVGDVIPAGDRHTRMIVTGNLLHEDSLIKRLEKNIQEEKMAGVYRAYPLLDEQGNPTWPGKFPNQQAIENEKARGITDIAWHREYLLKIIAQEGQVVYPEWIKNYDTLPQETPELKYRYTFIGIDLAIGQKESSDYTAMVAISVYGYKENLKLFVHANPINERLSFKAMKEKAKFLSYNLGRGSLATILVEEVGIQGVLTQELKGENFPAKGCKIQGDKKERLSIAASLMEQGIVFFPNQGTEKLIEQLLGFGKENHDDLVDAFSMTVIEIIKKENGGNFFFLRMGDGPDFHPSSVIALEDNKPKPKDPIPGLLPEKIEKPWKNDEELKKLEKKVDLEIMRRDLDNSDRHD